MKHYALLDFSRSSFTFCKYCQVKYTLSVIWFMFPLLWVALVNINGSVLSFVIANERLRRLTYSNDMLLILITLFRKRSQKITFRAFGWQRLYIYLVTALPFMDDQWAWLFVNIKASSIKHMLQNGTYLWLKEVKRIIKTEGLLGIIFQLTTISLLIAQTHILAPLVWNYFKLTLLLQCHETCQVGLCCRYKSIRYV